jgi:purine-binding chemotaxis protein CheW
MTAPPPKPSRPPAPTGGRPVACPPTLCSFWLAGERLALDIALVAEVLHLEEVTTVPQSHAALLGIFNLRGTPVALVDLRQLLGQEDLAQGQASLSALVVRSGTLVAGFAVDRADAVLQAANGRFVPSQPGEEQEMVLGFLEFPDDAGKAVTVLDSNALVARVDRLRYGSADAS